MRAKKGCVCSYCCRGPEGRRKALNPSRTKVRLAAMAELEEDQQVADDFESGRDHDPFEHLRAGDQKPGGWDDFDDGWSAMRQAHLKFALARRAADPNPRPIRLH
jgi:hypothetical protein